MKISDLSIRIKLLLVQGVFLIFLIIFSLFITSYTSNSFKNSAVSGLERETESLINMVDTYNSSLKNSTEKLENVFISYFSDDYSLDETRKIDINGVTTPALLNSGTLINNNFSQSR